MSNSMLQDENDNDEQQQHHHHQQQQPKLPNNLEKMVEYNPQQQCFDQLLFPQTSLPFSQYSLSQYTQGLIDCEQLNSYIAEFDELIKMDSFQLYQRLVTVLEHTYENVNFFQHFLSFLTRDHPEINIDFNHIIDPDFPSRSLLMVARSLECKDIYTLLLQHNTTHLVDEFSYQDIDSSIEHFLAFDIRTSRLSVVKLSTEKFITEWKIYFGTNFQPKNYPNIAKSLCYALLRTKFYHNTHYILTTFPEMCNILEKYLQDELYQHLTTTTCEQTINLQCLYIMNAIHHIDIPYKISSRLDQYASVYQLLHNQVVNSDMIKWFFTMSQLSNPNRTKDRFKFIKKNPFACMNHIKYIHSLPLCEGNNDCFTSDTVDDNTTLFDSSDSDTDWYGINDGGIDNDDNNNDDNNHDTACLDHKHKSQRFSNKDRIKHDYFNYIDSVFSGDDLDIIDIIDTVSDITSNNALTTTTSNTITRNNTNNAISTQHTPNHNPPCSLRPKLMMNNESLFYILNFAPINFNSFQWYCTRGPFSLSKLLRQQFHCEYPLRDYGDESVLIKFIEQAILHGNIDFVYDLSRFLKTTLNQYYYIYLTTNKDSKNDTDFNENETSADSPLYLTNPLSNSTLSNTTAQSKSIASLPTTNPTTSPTSLFADLLDDFFTFDNYATIFTILQQMKQYHHVIYDPTTKTSCDWSLLYDRDSVYFDLNGLTEVMKQTREFMSKTTTINTPTKKISDKKMDAFEFYITQLNNYGLKLQFDINIQTINATKIDIVNTAVIQDPNQSKNLWCGIPSSTNNLPNIFAFSKPTQFLQDCLNYTQFKRSLLVPLYNNNDGDCRVIIQWSFLRHFVRLGANPLYLHNIRHGHDIVDIENIDQENAHNNNNDDSYDQSDDGDHHSAANDNSGNNNNNNNNHYVDGDDNHDEDASVDDGFHPISYYCRHDQHSDKLQYHLALYEICEGLCEILLGGIEYDWMTTHVVNYKRKAD